MLKNIDIYLLFQCMEKLYTCNVISVDRDQKKLIIIELYIVSYIILCIKYYVNIFYIIFNYLVFYSFDK